MIAVSILNWNGATVTIDCLKSMAKVIGEDFFIVLADNGSDDNSPQEMADWLINQKEFKVISISEDEEDTLPENIAGKTIIYYRLKENYGFAIGNNRALSLASKYNPRYGLLLNNDTEVEPDFLVKLSYFLNEHPDYSAVTPMICYYDDKNLIWNCGGNLFLGLRKYYFAKENVNSVPDKEFFRIKFITGCALFFRFSLVQDGRLLTERFFHGEEDFEFSYRMKDKGMKIACVPTSKIYHKVSVSINRFGKIGPIYNYYLNRFIDMRLRMPLYKYRVWEKIYRIYVKRLLKGKGIKESEVNRMLSRLQKECREMDGVSRQKFLEIMKY